MAGASSETGFVVVTGADGFVGRALVAHFREAGRPFRALVRRHDASQARKPEFRAVGDLATLPDTELDALLAGATAIVHLAGRAHVLDEPADDPAAAYAAANVLATARLARAAVRTGLRRFVFASTVKVNGEASAPGRPCRPGDPPDPRDAYARSKRDAERELAAIAAGTDLAPIVLRLPLVYGPGVKGNFAALLDGIARERPLPLGAVRNRRSLLYVGNLVEAIDAALDAPIAPAGVHFVADAESVAVPELARACGAALGVPARLPAVPVWLLELGGWVLGRRAQVARLVGTLEVDAASFTAATGWRPRYRLEEGLAATAAWWRMRHAI
jgi:nucleoside-diphosphate-sugar epimerase